jgi:hypothetical protein
MRFYPKERKRRRNKSGRNLKEKERKSPVENQIDPHGLPIA